MSRSQIISQEEFDRLSKELFNKRIGNFLYVHHEANPKWHIFRDVFGNSVQHGGRCDSTDVIVRIVHGSGNKLRPRLKSYMNELVGRHKEKLHEEGEKRFHGVTITLPSQLFASGEVVIHTGSGCCYNQDEIAYEVMAALTGFPVYKVITPDCYYDFKRMDTMEDEHLVTYWHISKGIEIQFSYLEDRSYISVSCVGHQRVEDFNKFHDTMYALLDEYVKGRSIESGCSRALGYTFYKSEQTKDSFGINVEEVEGSSLCFKVDVPYRGSINFPRLDFAKWITDELSQVFKEERKAA